MIKRLLWFLYRSIKYIERTASESKAQILSGIPIKCLGDITFDSPKISFGYNVVLYPGVKFRGDNISIGDNTIIHSTKGVTIGNDCSIAAGCYIIDSNHGIRKDSLIRTQKSEAAECGIKIGRDVWLGTQCIVLKGATIDDGAVIAANSVVNSHIPANAIVGGVPARIIRYRFHQDLIDNLLSIQWWSYPDEVLSKLAPLADKPQQFIEELRKYQYI